MGIKTYNPYTPSRRNMTGSDFSEIMDMMMLWKAMIMTGIATIEIQNMPMA